MRNEHLIFFFSNVKKKSIIEKKNPIPRVSPRRNNETLEAIFDDNVDDYFYDYYLVT